MTASGPDPIYAAQLRLVYAILAQGLQDAANGDPGAVKWLNGRAFAHWCEWVDVDAPRLRRRMQDVVPGRFVIRPIVYAGRGQATRPTP